MWPFTSRKPRTTDHAKGRRNSFRPSLESLENRCLLSGGVLDPTFGTGGIVSTNVFPDILNSPRAIATYASEGTANDGKIILASTTAAENGYYAVERFNLNGTPDRSFGVNGQVTTKLGTSSATAATAVAVQPDGKVLAAGNPDLVRYTVSGSLDTTFASKGEVVLPFRVLAMSLQPDGKILVAGSPYNQTGLSLARYNADGSLDSSFATGGTETIHFALPFTSPVLALQPGTGSLDPNSGKIVVAGQISGVATVVRFNTNGSLDTSFGGAGTGYTTISSMHVGSPAVAIQTDDCIVVAATVATATGTSVDFGLARLNPDGVPDATFGSGGFAAPALPIIGSVVRSVAIEADGSIIVAGGNNRANAGDRMVVARYNAADGSLDTSFGNNGVGVIGTGPFASSGPYAVAMALEPDGRIVEVGIGVNGSPNTTVARFLATGPQIGSFTASPNPVAAGSSVTLTAANVVALNPTTTITQVAFYADTNGDGKLEPGTDTLLGYGTLTNTGTWTFTYSTAGLTSGTYTLFAQAKDSDGAFSDPLLVTLQVV